MNLLKTIEDEEELKNELMQLVEEAFEKAEEKIENIE